MGAYINGDYKSEYSGDQIDAAIGKVRTPDSTPTASSDNLVTSGGVKAALDQKQAVINDLSTIRSNATDGKAAYDKIDEGLAKSDLDAGVQASLDKADAAAPQSTTYTKTEVDNALATKAAKNGSGSEDFNAKSVILPTTGSGSGTSQILGANSPVPGRYYLPDSASGGQGYTLATTDMVNQKADKDTDAVEGNLAEFDANGNPVDSGIPSTKIGEIEEEVSVLRNSAGIAEGIADTISAGTPQEFVFRQSGGDGVNYMKRIKGKTLAWNQLIQGGTFSVTENGITISSDGSGKLTIIANNPTGINQVSVAASNVISGHKYCCRGWNYSTNGFQVYNDSAFPGSSSSGPWVITAQQSGTIYINVYAPASLPNGTYYSYPQLIDLTLMYGAGNEPSTAAEFEALYPDGYYPYNPGTLISNDASEIETVGFNQWDEEIKQGYTINGAGEEVLTANSWCSRNYIPLLAGLTYYLKSPSYINARWYDADKNYLGYSVIQAGVTFTNVSAFANAAYLRFNGVGETYNHDICINLSDASFNGQYEPYWKRRIELNLSTLLDVDGNLVFPYGGMHGVGTAFDSMKPEADGFIHYANRVFARVDMGSLNWVLAADNVFAANVSGRKYGNGILTIVCEKYLVNNTLSVEKTIYPNNSSNQVFITDSAYTDVASFKAAMAGVYLVYEVATPAVVELAEPIPNAILVDSYGTEKAIYPTHEDGTPSAPFACDSNYSISVKNLVAKLNALNG